MCGSVEGKTVREGGTLEIKEEAEEGGSEKQLEELLKYLNF